MNFVIKGINSYIFESKEIKLLHAKVQELYCYKTKFRD